jgi:hypothetical protein
MPVAQEHASFAAVLFGCVNEPVNELFAVLIVYQTVGFETKMDICANSNFFK